MICNTCIHKEVCYEKEEDRQALKYCSDYFNFVEELEKTKEEIDTLYGVYLSRFTERLVIKSDVMRILDEHISELKGENNEI